MDIACLENCLTETECQTFEENGFLIVENALSPKIVENLTAAVDRFDAEYRSTKELSPYDRLHMLDFVAKDVQFNVRPSAKVTIKPNKAILIIKIDHHNSVPFLKRKIK